MATTRFIYFASIVSLVTGRRLLLTFCETGFIPQLLDYAPAASFCFETFPVESAAFPVSNGAATVTSTLTVSGGSGAAITITETVLDGTPTVASSTSTVTRFSTVIDDSVQTVVVTESPVAQKRDAAVVNSKKERSTCHETKTESTYSTKETSAAEASANYGQPGGDGAYDDSRGYGYDSHGGGSYSSDDDDSYDPYTSDGYDASGYDASGYEGSADGTAYPMPVYDPTGYDYDGYYPPYNPSPTLDVSSTLVSSTITLAPTSTAVLSAAEAFQRLQGLESALQGAICECIQFPDFVEATTVTTTITSVVSNPVSASTATVTILATGVASSSFDIIVTSTVFTTTTTGPIQTCVADASSNILVNGGFDDNGAGTATRDPNTAPWKIDFDDGFGVNFFSHSDLAQTPPNYAVFPADNSGRIFFLFQNLTNIDTTIPYIVSFWYQPYAFNPRSWPGSNPSQLAQGACHFDVTWGDIVIFKKDFAGPADAAQTWVHYNSPVSIQQAVGTATLQFHMECDQAWLGDGSAVLNIDSVAIYPSDSLDCLI